MCDSAAQSQLKNSLRGWFEYVFIGVNSIFGLTLNNRGKSQTFAFHVGGVARKSRAASNRKKIGLPRVFIYDGFVLNLLYWTPIQPSAHAHDGAMAYVPYLLAVLRRCFL